MSVDRNEVRRIADLAKLDLDDTEAERLTEEMNRILEHAERLRGLDEVGARDGDEAGPSDGGEAHASDGTSASTSLSQTTTVPDPLVRPPASFAPEMAEGFFTVPPPPGVVGSDRE